MSSAAAPHRDRAAEAREDLRRLWESLPAFLVTGTAVCVATGIVLWLGRGVSPVTLLLLALIPGPLYGALVHQSVRALQGEAPGSFSLPASVRRMWRPSVTLLLPPAVVGALALVALFAAGRSASWLPLVPAGLGAAVTVLLAIAALIGLPLAAADPELRGIRLTLSALHTAARRPAPLLGTVAVVVIAVWAALQFSGTLLFLAPAPLAVVSAIAVRPLETGDDQDD
jgi:hypothetical protein